MRGNSQSLEADWEGSLLEGMTHSSHTGLLCLHPVEAARLLNMQQARQADIYAYCYSCDMRDPATCHFGKHADAACMLVVQQARYLCCLCHADMHANAACMLHMQLFVCC